PPSSPLSLHDALPISASQSETSSFFVHSRSFVIASGRISSGSARFGSHAFSHSIVTQPVYPIPRKRVRNFCTGTSPLPSLQYVADRKSTRLNSSHDQI